MDGGMGENFQRWSFPSLTPDDVLVEIFDGLHSSYPLLPLLQQVISLSQGQHPTEVEENGPNPTQNVLHPDLRQEPYTTRQPCQFAQKDGSRAHAIQQQAMPGGMDTMGRPTPTINVGASTLPPEPMLHRSTEEKDRWQRKQ